MHKYSIGLYEKAIPGSFSLKEKLIIAKECNYDFFEMSIDETEHRMARLDWTSQERAELVDAMRATGLPIRSICLSAHRKYPLGASSLNDRIRSLEIMYKAINLADDIGVRIIQIAGYDVYYEESTDETRANFELGLKKSVEYAAQKGVVLAFETMENEFLNTVEKCMYYVNMMNSPYLAVYPDTGNITNSTVMYGTSVLNDMECGRGHLVALHLKESVPGKFREIPYFTGHVDFNSLIDKAWSLGVRRYLTEMWDVGKDSWQEDIIFACTSMRNILNKLEDKEENLK